ncbi:M48 family metalloprotease [Luteibacter aegosomaticola]|uniref:M48 family metallopeptidase n=1 Tax=Luteibacter aegosomaticola TaxID=2911538 RepID=UPI001FFACEBC|nr:M48 family metallopeptidase [Luteibacter aegosomaticola]UPG91987.1 M48 family metalloprotease [Luteibacter aegosomaticola]
METIYPVGPSGVPAAFARPGAAYRRHAWIAVISLMLFIALYLALTGWFAWIGISQLMKVVNGGFLAFLTGIGSLFLAAFLLKGLFFRKRRADNAGMELTRAQEPRLFAFLDRLADEAGAPRPHRVFVSGRVNAGVFYDLSLLNLLFPSRKNLEIGLALVNMLNLGEFKAVLAHEFGHFAQRSMAVGRWVYTAQQIASHIVVKRDALDGFLRRLSRLDIRIAWVGWLLGIVVWALRALVDVVFRLVVVAQRMLSREMEMQADLVAVSLTGSDALILALHRLEAAEDAWERSLSFMRNELAAKHPPRDLFAVQEALIGRLARIYNDVDYGARPLVPASDGAAFRVFKGELAQPPRMWSTHPMNHEREANAKRHYLFAPADERSAWLAFHDAEGLRERMTRELVGETETAPVALQETLAHLEAYFDREHLKAQYRGVYLGYAPMRNAAEVEHLFEETAITRPLVVDELYPASLAEDLERLRSLEREDALLCSLRDRVYEAPDGIIRHRGRILRRSQLPDAIALVDTERAAVRASLQVALKRVRSLHLAAAAKISPAWRTYMVGVIGVLHYAEHAEANLKDANAGLAAAWQVSTVRGVIDERGARRIIAAAADVYRALSQPYRLAHQIDPGPVILTELNWPTWAAVLGNLELNAPNRTNINEWLRLFEGWVRRTTNALSALRSAALDELLRVEGVIAAATQGVAPPDAPASVPFVPVGYDTLLAGAERGRRRIKQGLWERFLSGSGFVPGLARTVAAVAVVGFVVAFGYLVDRADLWVYNGLDRTVVATVGDQHVTLAPNANALLHVRTGHSLAVSTHAEDGQAIESFTMPVDSAATQLVYTVAAAEPLKSWTAAYGNATPSPPHLVGPDRWQTAYADFVFVPPPEKIDTKSGGGTRSVLGPIEGVEPGAYLEAVKNVEARTAMILAHVRFDAPDSRFLPDWLAAASGLPGYDAAFAARLAQFPHDIMALRVEQNATKGTAHDEACARDRALAAASPHADDLAYLVVRCLPSGQARDQAFVDGFQQHPGSAWFANAAAAVAADHGHYDEAVKRYELALSKSPALARGIAGDVYRLERFVAPAKAWNERTRFMSLSPWLRTVIDLEEGTGDVDGPYRALTYLNQGRLDAAVEAAQGSDIEAHVVRLAAASRGASAALRTRAAKLPLNEGMNEQTVWVALAAGADPHDPSVAEVLSHIDATYDSPGAVVKVEQFLAAVRGGKGASAEALLDGVPVVLRAEALAAGSSMLGDRAPVSWRSFAKALLFGGQRPWMG